VIGVLLALIKNISVKKETVLFSLVALSLFLFFKPNAKPSHVSSEHKRSLVIIGIDSLNFQHLTSQNSPFIHQLLQVSQQFSNAQTPLARTFPAWVSLLSGLYPSHHQMRFNLMHPSLEPQVAYLPEALKKAGYQTFFATDERRFNSIDKLFGFDEIIGPKSDAFDFMLTNFDDYPLSNLFLLLPGSSYLFPYRHLNRAHWQFYAPEQFDKTLIKSLQKSSKPFFLAVHYTLTHWPYRYRDSDLKPKVSNEIEKQRFIYKQALNKIDEELHSLIKYLKTLKPVPLIVLISDHGETLLEENSQAIKPALYQEVNKSPLLEHLERTSMFDIGKSLGHGSDLLSPKQSKILMAFIDLEAPDKKGKTHSQEVSLIDLKKTLEAMLDLPVSHNDGENLYPLMQGKIQELAPRAMFFETGLTNLPLTKSLELDLPSISRISNRYFEISNKDATVHLKKNKLRELLLEKQYAMKENNILYVLYKGQICYFPITIDLETLKWTDTRTSTFAEKKHAMRAFVNLLEYINQPAHLIDPQQICS
jgi:hypothetical protein